MVTLISTNSTTNVGEGCDLEIDAVHQHIRTLSNGNTNLTYAKAKDEHIFTKVPSREASNVGSTDLTASNSESEYNGNPTLAKSRSWLDFISKDTLVSRKRNVAPEKTAQMNQLNQLSAQVDTIVFKDSKSDAQNKHFDEEQGAGGNGDDGNDNSGNNGGGDGDDGDDEDDDYDTENTPDKKDDVSSKKQPPGTSQRPLQAQGIWSWMGYGPPQGTLPGDSPSDNSTEPNKAADEEEFDNPPIDKDPLEEGSKIDDQKTSNTQDASSQHSKSYWKSLFYSPENQQNPPETPEEDSQKDTVVVEHGPLHNEEGQQDSELRRSKDDNVKKLRLPLPGHRSTKNDQQNIVEEDQKHKATKTDNSIGLLKKNHVLPTFQSQFSPNIEASTPESPSILGKAIGVINYIFSQAKYHHPNKHELLHNLSILRFVNDIKKDPENTGGVKIAVVGVHGWFPMKLVRSVMGEPTGTSEKFCEQMSMAAKYYFESEHGVKIHDNSITMIPLQGEGKVEERVDKLFNSLVNNPAWMSALISADVILWATHSQGTPVSTLLLRRLLDRELVNVQRQAVSLLAMAGICYGPFPTLKGSLIVKYFEADAARELFEFMDSNSTISQKFADSLGYILRRGIKTTLIGSMQDQVVPLYSAIMTGTSHPNILRGMYIDSHIYSQDDFLISIISFALRLRNVGLSDHGLLTHISEVLAGNLYSLEGGHSTIYEELDVYVIAVRHLFETAPFGQQKLVCSYVSSDAVVNLTDKRSLSASKDLITPMEAKIDPFQSKVRLNPFYLPWAMRGIFDDTRISNDPILSQELKNLKVLYDSWSPASAKLREIKFRLEPLKAKL